MPDPLASLGTLQPTKNDRRNEDVMATEDAVLDHQRKLLDAHLTAAWLRRCGHDDKPGEWMIPGEFMEIIDGSIDVEVYPIYAVMKDGRPSMWSSHVTPGRPDVADAWEWRIGAGWDDFDREEIDKLEDLGGCFDDHHVTFLALGSHQERPPITDEFVAAFALAEGLDA